VQHTLQQLANQLTEYVDETLLVGENYQ